MGQKIVPTTENTVYEYDDHVYFIHNNESGCMELFRSWPNGGNRRRIYTFPENVEFDRSRQLIPGENSYDLLVLPAKVSKRIRRCPVCNTPYPVYIQKNHIRKVYDCYGKSHSLRLLEVQISFGRYRCMNPDCGAVFYDCPEQYGKSKRMTDRYKDAVLFYVLKHSSADSARRFHISDVQAGKILRDGLIYLRNRYPFYLPESLGLFRMRLMGSIRLVLIDMEHGLIVWILQNGFAQTLDSLLAKCVSGAMGNPKWCRPERVKLITVQEQTEYGGVLGKYFPEQPVQTFEEGDLVDALVVIEESYPNASSYVSFSRYRDWMLYGTEASRYTRYRIMSRHFENDDRTIRGREDSFVHGGGVDLFSFCQWVEKFSVISLDYIEKIPPGPGVFVEKSLENAERE